MIKNYDTNIDIEKSIEIGRVVYYNRLSHFVFDKLIYIFFVLLFTYVFIRDQLLYDSLNSIDNLLNFNFFLLIAFSFLTISAFRADKLRRVRGLNEELNRDFILEVMVAIKWETRSSSTKLTVAEPDSAYQWNGGVQFTVIYDNADVLINCTTYHFGNAVSPVHFINNRIARWELTKEFNKKIKKNSA
ncbi:MAG: hypothetical protein ACERKD_24955 [Prolixibacteraceae bacterium]